ncbi:Lrp/AsnC ligand binding domain-containing protein [Nitrosotalea sinensis]|nr:Lrp/AsnC ligand binding domain-containing protein [Candidatus Nitrosotalea sinensis]
MFMQTSGSPKYVESAYVMITCEDCTQSMISELESIPEIKEIHPTCGNYDVIVKIETDSVDILRQVILEKIRKIEQIRSTTILISSPVLVY